MLLNVEKCFLAIFQYSNDKTMNAEREFIHCPIFNFLIVK